MSLTSTFEQTLSLTSTSETPKLRRVGKLGQINSAKTWRRDSGHPIDLQKQNTTIVPKFSAGQIVYLPSQSQIKKDSIVHKWETHENTFDHPALVVEIINDEIVEIRTITTLGDTPLGEKGNYRSDPKKLQAHLLIQHPKNHDKRWNNPNGSRVLHLNDGKHLAAPSYLRLDKQLWIENTQLRAYTSDTTGLFLDDDSLQFVRQQEHIQLYAAPSSWPSAKANIVRADDWAQLRMRSSKSQELRLANATPASNDDLASSPAPTPAQRPASDTFLGPRVSFTATIKAQKEARGTKTAVESGDPLLRKTKSFP